MVNVTKKEYVQPLDIGGLPKLWEWCVGRTAGIFPYLLRKSSGRGGGDIEFASPLFAGRWAGDEVYLVGDYDESHLYETARTKYRNISRELAAEYNQFVELADRKLHIK